MSTFRSSDTRSRPRVGITSYLAEVGWGGGVWKQEAAFLPEQYLDFVQAGGGVPVLLPPSVSAAEIAVTGIDALVLSGGPDVSPERYNARRDPDFEKADGRRDDWEIALADIAIRRGTPLLAICRGMQILNITKGGTLHQHLPNVVHNNSHRVSVGTFSGNKVRTAKGTKIRSIVGDTVTVPCHHHQAIDQLGSDMIPGAVAEDGTIESIEAPGGAFILGVQWHPEEDVDYSLATALVTATRRDQSGNNWLS